MDGQCRKNWCSIPWKFTWTSQYLPFLPETKKIKNVEKLLTNLYDKNEYVIQIRNLRQALNHRLILKIVHRVVKFNQKDWLQPYIAYIDMNTKLKQKAKNYFQKYFKSFSNIFFNIFVNVICFYMNSEAVCIHITKFYILTIFLYFGLI